MAIDSFSHPAVDLPYPAISICKSSKYDASEYLRAVFDNFEYTCDGCTLHEDTTIVRIAPSYIDPDSRQYGGNCSTPAEIREDYKGVSQVACGITWGPGMMDECVSMHWTFSNKNKLILLAYIDHTDIRWKLLREANPFQGAIFSHGYPVVLYAR